jgi:hypothetical protein
VSSSTHDLPQQGERVVKALSDLPDGLFADVRVHPCPAPFAKIF